MPIKRVVETRVITESIDLRTIPFKDWPQEAKDLAYSLVSTERQRDRLRQELFQHEWLAAKVEAYLNTPLEDFF